MHKILVLVDFTHTSEIALDQAIALSKLTGAGLTISHIATSERQMESEDFKMKMAPYIEEAEKQGVDFNLFVVSGNFKGTVTAYVNEHKPDLCVVGTHGKRGLRQNLFGSNIYDLTKSLSTTLLVVNDHAPVTVGGFKKVLLPVASHHDFLLKVKQTSKLLAGDGEVIIFNITKAGVSLDNQLMENVRESEEYLKSKNQNVRYVEKSSTTLSVGYSRETLEYARDHGVDLISIMTESAHQRGTEAMDKENILVNTEGIAVLCAND